ncbi:hypothetical protein Cni_G09327 [Canna indica]|uniref:Uncharacterized protein n=1 Tax=Canna indica TaxID=4628 RepID=A0AAQ3Q7M4_9LILI|nr:hypothetical protein Cni_G09327 [Canna indica]
MRRSARLGSCGFKGDCLKRAEERKAQLNDGLIISNLVAKIKLQESSACASPTTDLGLLTTNMFSNLRSLPIAAHVEALGFRCNPSFAGSGSVLSYLAGGQNRLTLEEQVASLGGKADSVGLSPIEMDDFCEAKCRLDKLYGDEDSYWRHRAKQRWVKLGDRNTRFFQQCASLTKKRN